MIDKQNKLTMKNVTATIADLKKYIGEFITYKTVSKTYQLRISEVARDGVRVYDPVSGATARLSLEKASEIIRMKYVTA